MMTALPLVRTWAGSTRLFLLALGSAFALGCGGDAAASASTQAELALADAPLIPLPDSIRAAPGSLLISDLRAVRSDEAVGVAFLARVADRLGPGRRRRHHDPPGGRRAAGRPVVAR